MAEVVAKWTDGKVKAAKPPVKRGKRTMNYVTIK